LEQALRTARGEVVEDWTPALHLGLAGRLPEAWIPEPEVRINLYARLARISSETELDDLAGEMEDRFGSLPSEAAALLDLTRIRLLARQAGIARVDAGPAAIALTPHPGAAPDAAAAGLIVKEERLLLQERTEADEARLERVKAILEALIPA
jgi:transcription-repair coupling factor (superfamily II helicase)